MLISHPAEKTGHGTILRSNTHMPLLGTLATHPPPDNPWAPAAHLHRGPLGFLATMNIYMPPLQTATQGGQDTPRRTAWAAELECRPSQGPGIQALTRTSSSWAPKLTGGPGATLKHRSVPSWRKRPGARPPNASSSGGRCGDRDVPAITAGGPVAASRPGWNGLGLPRALLRLAAGLGGRAGLQLRRGLQGGEGTGPDGRNGSTPQPSPRAGSKHRPAPGMLRLETSSSSSWPPAPGSEANARGHVSTSIQGRAQQAPSLELGRAGPQLC